MFKPQTTLPFDIFYAIIGVIATTEDGFDTLKSCSLTCKILHPLCQRHLFTNLILPPTRDYHEPPIYAAQFAAILERKPEIANYVKTFGLFIGRSVLATHRLPYILDKLRNVVALEICGQGDIVAWDSISSDLQESLTHIIQSPQLTHLSLRLISGFPITSILMPCTRLIDVELELLTDPVGTLCSPLAMELPGVPVDDVEPARLENFSTNSSSNAAMLLLQSKQQHGLPTIDFTHLSEFSFELDVPCDRILADLILQSTVHLKILRCEVLFATNLAGILQTINPASKKSLQSLEFSFGIQYETEDPLCGLPQELGFLSGKNQIEGLTFEVLVQKDCDCSTRIDDWNKLDQILTADAFPSLRGVAVEVTIVRHRVLDGMLQTRLLTMSEEAFKGLKGRPSVQFEFIVTYENL